MLMNAKVAEKWITILLLFAQFTKFSCFFPGSQILCSILPGKAQCSGTPKVVWQGHKEKFLLHPGLANVATPCKIAAALEGAEDPFNAATHRRDAFVAHLLPMREPHAARDLIHVAVLEGHGNENLPQIYSSSSTSLRLYVRGSTKPRNRTGAGQAVLPTALAVRLRALSDFLATGFQQSSGQWH